MKRFILFVCMLVAGIFIKQSFVSAQTVIYLDLNAIVNGDGLTPDNPTNQMPSQTIVSDTKLYFNSDNGVQRIPSGRDNTFYITGSNIEITSYGSGRATVSGYEIISGGWTQVGTSYVWKQSFPGGSSGAGPIVGSVIDLSSINESPTGDVLNWYNLETEHDRIGTFQADPSVLPIGSYGYDWQNEMMYINVGADPNSRSIGISQVGRLFNTTGNPSNVKIHGLRMIGFARSVMNIGGGSNHWHIYDNELYGNGGMYNVKEGWYHGSGIQPNSNASHLEIDHNTIIETFDSAITPQHFGGTSGHKLFNIYIHHNYVEKWSLGGVEIADWGTNEIDSITIEDNTFVNGGKGYSGTGDTPQGKTDGIQTRGGNNGISRVSRLTVRRNNINSHDAAFIVGGNTITDGVILEDNILWGSTYGIKNQRKDEAYILAKDNVLCDNQIQISDQASASVYINNTLSTECSTTSSTINIEKPPRKVYPSITEGVVNIESGSEKNAIVLIDINGRKVGQWSNTSSIDISSKPSGFYMLIYKDPKNSISTFKIIKK